jgi:uncharacterized protein (TIGR02284 family)
METTEKTIDVINDLVKINNDRVAGFEKAAQDLKEDKLGLKAIFEKLADESRDNTAELIRYASQYGVDADDTSAAGALHRAWIEIRAAFSGNDTASILGECERGEDAIKKAYATALEDSGEISYEVAETIRRQQQSIIEGHNLIKSLRDQSEQEESKKDHNSFSGQNSYKEGEENDEWKKKPSDFQPNGAIEAGNNNSVGENGMDENELALANEVPAGSLNRNDFNNSGEFNPGPTDVGEYQTTNVNRSPGGNASVNNYQSEKPASNDSQLKEFFVNELKDLLWAERKLVDTLPKMEEAATSMELREAFHNHLAETEGHVQRLEQIFGTLGLDPDTTKCEAMDGIVDEGEEIIDDTDEGTATRDVGLIFAGQKVEHYEIASYGGMISLANTLGYTEAVSILTMTLNEEKSADALLTQIAENSVNYRAAY